MFGLRQLRERTSAALWEGGGSRRHWWQRWPAGLGRLGYAVLRDLYRGRVSLHATSLVYTTLLSLVPLLAISFSILTAFGANNVIQPLLTDLLNPLGPRAGEISARIVGFVKNMKVGVLGSLGLIFLLYTVFSIMLKIEAAMNEIWHTVEDRPFAQRFSTFLTIVIIAPVFMASAMGLTASITSSAVVAWIGRIEPFGHLLAFGGRILPYILVSAVFALIYRFMPNGGVRLKSALIGGLFAAVLWQTIGWTFAAFVATSNKYPAIYSAFATLILFLMWLYLAWFVFLLGASAAFYYQNPEYTRPGDRQNRLSQRQAELLAVMIMILIGRRYYRGEPNWSLPTLAGHLRLPADAVGEVLRALVQGGLLTRTEADVPRYLPQRALDVTPAKAIFDAMRNSDASERLDLSQLPAHPVADHIVGEADKALIEAIGDRSIEHLVTIAYDGDTGSPTSRRSRRRMGTV